ncbi:MAG TPA: pseudouridine synthase [Candidatus Limnocylindrales bacterium]
MPAERLQKILASAGVASRRQSETLIANGRVTVDGRVATLGAQVDPATARIEVDGRPIVGPRAPTYLALHKPGGVTSTVRDRHAAATVLDFVPTALLPDGGRLYPVGRLDQDSEGLLLLTNDGDWAERVLHPRFGVEREYAIGVATSLTEEQAARLRDGIPLDEGLATLAQPLRLATGLEVKRLNEVLDPPTTVRLTWYRGVLAQGWKRQLRRMFAAVGAPIDRLVRVRIGPLRLDELPSGRVRRLTAPEVRALGAGPDAPPPRATPRRKSATGARRPQSRRPAPPAR